MNRYRNDDPPDETEDPSADYIVEFFERGEFDRAKIRAAFMLRFENDFDARYIADAFDQSFETAEAIFRADHPDPANLSRVQDDDDPDPFSGPSPWDYFQISPDQ